MSRNQRKTATERRRKPKRVSGMHFHDFGAVLDLKKDPKILKKRSENDTEKQTRKMPKMGGVGETMTEHVSPVTSLQINKI